MIDKRRCKAAMRQTLRMNLEHEIWYQLTFGEQDLYRMAWLMTETPFNVVRKPAGHLRDTILEHDPEGNLLFQHRCGAKWKLSALENRRIPGFLFEEECFGYLSELRGFARDCCPQ